MELHTYFKDFRSQDASKQKNQGFQILKKNHSTHPLTNFVLKMLFNSLILTIFADIHTQDVDWQFWRPYFKDFQIEDASKWLKP